MPEGRRNPNSPDPADKGVGRSARRNTDPAGGPKLVAKPILPVAKPIAPVGLTEGTPATSSQATDSGPKIRVAAARSRRQQGLAGPWLGWSLMVLLIVVVLAGSILWLSMRNDPWLTFQPTPETPSLRGGPADGVPPLDSPPLDSPPPRRLGPPEPANVTDDSGERVSPSAHVEPAPATSIPAMEAPSVQDQGMAQSDRIADPADLTASLNSVDRQVSSAASQDPANRTTTVEDDSEATDRPLDSLDRSTVSEANDSHDSRPRDNPSPAAGDVIDSSRDLVILRQMELAVMALSASRMEMATGCRNSAAKWAGADPQYAAGLELLDTLVNLRQSLYRTVQSRLPLLEKVGELPIDKTYASVLAANQDGVVLRFEGQRREFPVAELPWSVVAGVLRVTVGSDPRAEQTRLALVALLRGRFAHEETVSAATEELREMLANDWQSPELPRAELDQVLRFAQARGQVADYLGLADQVPPVPWDVDWSAIYLESRDRFRTHTDWQAMVNDDGRSRHELEAAAWLQLESASPASVAGHLGLLHHLGLARGDLGFLLDNLQRLDRYVALESDHVLWADLGRALLAKRPTDARLVEDLERLQRSLQAEPSGWSAAARNGLLACGRQLAQRLSQSTERRQWVRVFEASNRNP